MLSTKGLLRGEIKSSGKGVVHIKIEKKPDYVLCEQASYGTVDVASVPRETGVNTRKTGLALVGAALAVCALCGVVVMSRAGPSELMEVRLANGRIVDLVPAQALRQHRMTQLFGPGDLPIPIEDDGLPGGDAAVVAGSNVHLFEHFAPPQPYGMDNRRDPPYDTSFHGMGFGSDGR